MKDLPGGLAMIQVRRREFLGLITAWPSVARAQQREQLRVVGWLDGSDQSAASEAVRAAFREGLKELGWTEDRNVKIYRIVSDAARMRASAAELVSFGSEVILAGSAAQARALKEATRSIPIVFATGGDPVANGLVQKLNRPEANVTGFSSSEPTIGGKWLELLQEAAPKVTRVAIIFKPEIAPTAPYFIAAIESAARRLSVEAVKMPFRETTELVASINAFAARPVAMTPAMID